VVSNIRVHNRIRIARAFTCFNNGAHPPVPKALATFSADVLIVTALPDLYFDEDVQDRPARASFEHTLEALQQLGPLPLSIAVFSDATSFKNKRHDFFKKLRNQADQIIKLNPVPKAPFPLPARKIRAPISLNGKCEVQYGQNRSLHLFN